jgi:hypothetical protein
VLVIGFAQGAKDADQSKVRQVSTGHSQSAKSKLATVSPVLKESTN